MTEARELSAGAGPYRVGWRTKGTPLADLPITVTVSNAADRLVAMTWFSDTLSLVSNPNHPCMHADPKFSLRICVPAKRARSAGDLRSLKASSTISTMRPCCGREGA